MADDAPEIAEVPEPPWLRQRPRRTREPLSREAIVDAALRVLARGGVGALTMRAVAEELGAGASAIYWHVDNKEQLVQLVLDRVVEELPRPEPDSARWQEQLRQAARDARALMRRYPGIAHLSLGRVPLGPNAIRHIEWQLSVLRAGGLPDRVVALASDLLFLYVGGFAYEESLGMASPGGEGSFEEFVEAMRSYFASLPRAAFPNVAGLADELTGYGRDERFEFGLDILIAGIAAQRSG